MEMHRKKIWFLAYYSTHIDLFKRVRHALPPGICSEIKNVYKLTPISMLYSSRPSSGMPIEEFDEIITPYIDQARRKHPNADLEKVRARSRRRAVQWYNFFHKKLKDVDLLVVWSAFAIPLAAAVHAARKLGKQVVICENGVLPGTIAMDAVGVNYYSSLSGKDADFYMSFPIGEDIDELWENVWPQRPLRKASSTDNVAKSDDDKPLPSRYMLFAMQVHDDSQIRFFSPYFKDMVEAVTYVYNQINDYNRRTGDDIKIVVKEHPSDFGRVDYSDLRRSMPDVLFLRSTPISNAIKNSIGVVTINSSVAVEAMFSGLPVVTLGLAFYNIPGLVHHIKPEEERLSDVIPSLLNEPADHELRRHFLYFLWKYYLVPDPRRYPEEAQRSAQRIMDILNQHDVVDR